MDKLERYLDQVCRGIAGPRSLRQHLREELREHLRDAAAEHRAAGMTEAEALDRALEDFGRPEQIGTELAAEHGHSLMSVVIDKALDWKELTMKARWLWSTWAHLALALLIVAEIAFVAATMAFVMPKVKQIVMESQWGSAGMGQGADGWGMDAYLPRSQGFLDAMDWAADHEALLLAIVAVAWALFEWRARGENKPFARLALMGTAAVVLMAACAMSAAVASIPTVMAAPALISRPPERLIADVTARLDASLAALNQAIANKDWPAAEQQAGRATQLMDTLALNGGVAPTLAASPDPAKLDDLRQRLRAARDSIRNVRSATLSRDATRLEAATRKFDDAYQPIRAAASTATSTAPATKPAP